MISNELSVVLQRPRALIYHTTYDTKIAKPLCDGLHCFGDLTWNFDLQLASQLSCYAVTQSTCITIHPMHSSGRIRLHSYVQHIHMYSTFNLAPLPHCIAQWKMSLHAYMKLPVLIISKLASLRDLERACFVCINIFTQPGLQSEDAVVAHIHREAAECLWEREAAGRPLSVSSWPVVIHGWGPVESPCSPGMVPSGQGRREVDSLKKQCGDRTQTFGLHLSLSPQQRSGRWGEPETGGPTPHQLALQLASAHSQGNFSFSSSSLLRQLTVFTSSPSVVFISHPSTVLTPYLVTQKNLISCILVDYSYQRF